MAIMIEPKLEVPAELRDLAEKTIEQAEKAFGMFFDAASKSIGSVPGAGAEISKQALSFTEQNMKSAFEHARKLVHATDLQEAMRIQSEFLRSQFACRRAHAQYHDPIRPHRIVIPSLSQYARSPPQPFSLVESRNLCALLRIMCW